jgi:hypothetical protein
MAASTVSTRFVFASVAGVVGGFITGAGITGPGIAWESGLSVGIVTFCDGMHPVASNSDADNNTMREAMTILLIARRGL